MDEGIVVVSKHFKRKEFACRCKCGFESVDIELLFVLEEVRVFFDRPVRVLSGCRCEKHNKKIGGAKKSYHIRGMAADIDVLGIHPQEVRKFLNDRYHSKYGIGSYPSFTHIDVRRKKGRWKGEIK